MNRFYNIWLFIITLVSFPFALAVGLNEDFEFFGFNIQGEEFAYKQVVFIVGGAALFLLGDLRASKKWMGLNVMRQTKRFKYTSEISEERRRRVLIYNFIEIIFLLLFGLFFFIMTNEAIYLSIAYALLAVENLANSFVGMSKQGYGIGISSKALIRVDREVNVIYFKGLQKITKHQDTLYFDYINDLTLHIPLNCVPQDKETEFYQALKEQVDPNKVYYSGF